MASSIGAVGVAVEVFSWMTKHPEHPLAKALARPGHELQHRIATAEPSAAAARGRRGRARRLPRARGLDGDPGANRASAAGDLRPSRREDAGGLLHRRLLQPHARDAARRRPPSAGRDAGLPAEHGDAGRRRRGDRDPQALLARLGGADGARPARRRPDRAVGDRAHDRGRLHALRAPRDALPRRPHPADADHDERRPRRRGRERQADHLHARAARPPSRPDRRRLRGLRGGRDDRRPDRRHLGRAGLLVGRPRRRHRPARADRRLRREHRARGDEVRGVGRRPEHRRPRRLRERLGADRRSRSRGRSGRGSGESGSTPPASSSTARSGTRWATSTRAA